MAGKTTSESVLDGLGAAFGTRNGNARTTAAMLSNPGCQRRAVLDAARVDLRGLAERVGAPMPFGQSPFAIGQGNRFERRIKEDDHAELATALNDLLGIFEGLDGLRSVSLERVGKLDGRKLIEARAERTAEVLVRIADNDPDAPHVVDHGVTTLTVGGRPVYLEQDALAFREGEQLRVCEIKGFPIIDGSADARKVGAAARQTAVYVASIQDTLQAEGYDPELVSSEVVLVCPKNFSLKPIAVRVDVAREVRSLRRQLRRRETVDHLLTDAVERARGASIDLPHLLGRAGDDPEDPTTAIEVLDLLPYRYDPTCLSNCDLARHCQGCARSEGDPGLLGGEVAGLLGGVATLHDALDLIVDPTPDPDRAELAEMLATAEQARLDAMGHVH